jgi:hypothetical protein
MLNNQATSGEGQSSSSLDGNGNDYDYDYDLMTSMGRETMSVASLLAASLRTHHTDPRALAPAPVYQPGQEHDLMSLQGRLLGLPSLSCWPTQSGAPSLTDHPHGWEAASSQASLARMMSILDDAMAILDADVSVIARIANTRDTDMDDDDFLLWAFPSCSQNMPPARQ